LRHRRLAQVVSTAHSNSSNTPHIEDRALSNNADMVLHQLMLTRHRLNISEHDDDMTVDQGLTMTPLAAESVTRSCREAVLVFIRIFLDIHLRPQLP
jgi:hypothetical protein